MRRLALVLSLAALCLLQLTTPAWAKAWYSSYEDGVKLYDAGDLEAAAEELRAALVDRPSDAPLVFTYGMHYLRPYLPNWYLGSIYLKLGESDPRQAAQAVVHLERSASDLPPALTRDNKTHYLLAQAYDRAGRRQQALEACRKAVDSGVPGAAELLAKLAAAPLAPPAPERERPASPPPSDTPPPCELHPLRIGAYSFDPRAVVSQTEDSEWLVSVEDIWKLLDVDITWRVDAGYLVFENDGHVLMVYLDTDRATLDGEELALPSPARKLQGTAMAPIRLIAEKIACIKIEW